MLCASTPQVARSKSPPIKGLSGTPRYEISQYVLLTRTQYFGADGESARMFGRFGTRVDPQRVLWDEKLIESFVWKPSHVERHAIPEELGRASAGELVAVDRVEGWSAACSSNCQRSSSCNSTTEGQQRTHKSIWALPPG